MRPIVIGLLAAVLASVLPAAAMAATAPAAAPKGPEITADAKAAGMKAAPALMQAANIPCQVAAARFIGTASDPKTKTDEKFYEVACQGSIGFIVVDKGAKGPPAWETCLEAPRVDAVTGKPSAGGCWLPANLNDAAAVAPFVAKAGAPCEVTKARGIGHSDTQGYFEVACSDGRGLVVVTSSPPDLAKPIRTDTCLRYPPKGQVSCTLTNYDDQMKVVDTYLTQSGKPCTLKDKRYVGADDKGTNYFEVACQDGKGFFLQVAPGGGKVTAIDCAIADNIGGGCTLTNARAAQTEEASLYSKLAHNAGFPCDVSKYSPFEVNVPGHEVVELACSNRPDGAVAVLPVSASSGAKSFVYDCIHAQVAGYSCGFTSPDAALPTLTTDLKTLGKTSCVVSGHRFIARTTTSQGYVEVACADGNPGYIIEYSAPDLSPVTPTRAIPCVSASEIEGGCTMPTNQKKG